METRVIEERIRSEKKVNDLLVNLRIFHNLISRLGDWRSNRLRPWLKILRIARFKAVLREDIIDIEGRPVYLIRPIQEVHPMDCWGQNSLTFLKHYFKKIMREDKSRIRLDFFHPTTFPPLHPKYPFPYRNGVIPPKIGLGANWGFCRIRKTQKTANPSLPCPAAG